MNPDYGSAITTDEMAIGAPAWWLHRLVGQLLVDRPRMVLMDRYYRGNHPLPKMPRELETEYKRMLVQSRSNFMSVVVEAPAERLNVQGFRSRGDEDADDDAWNWWLDNGMDVDANLVIVNALAMGRGYLSVEKHRDDETPRVQIEDPRMCMVEMDQNKRQRRAAGLRLWNDDHTGNVMADVWIDGDACYHFTAKAERVVRSNLWPQTWEPAFPIDDRFVRLTDLELREEPAATLGQWCTGWTALGYDSDTHGEVPLVPLVNRPSTLKRPDGESEIDDVYLTQDRINEMLFNRSLAAFTAAFQQKWATGIDIPQDENTGKPVQPFKAAVDRLWADTSPDAAFGAFPATDLKNYIAAIEEDVQHIAVQTRTPRHYFLQQGQSPSGDAIKSAEAGLVAKVNEKQRIYGRSFAEVVRLRNVMAGNEGTKPVEVIWADPEFRTLAELSDAVIKQHQVGLLPVRSAREKLQYSPSEINRMETYDEQEALVRDTQAALEAEQAPAGPRPPGAPPAPGAPPEANRAPEEAPEREPAPAG
jgi:hypothetical protein